MLSKTPKTTIYLDTNTFDNFYNKSIDLLELFPKERYELFILPHNKYEIKQIPDSKCKEHFKKYFQELIDNEIIKVMYPFAFDTKDEEYPRYGGWDQGYRMPQNVLDEWQRLDDIPKFNKKKKKGKKNIMHPQETDKALAALSMCAPVLTFDRKNGPLRNAYDNGGNVIFLDEYKDLNNDDFFREIMEVI